jgi:sulfatase modifying factor 1
MISLYRMPRVVFSVIALALLGLLAVPARAQVTIDWVTVGDPGNVADTSPSGYGAVADSFLIGKYEVTIQQYTDFLNAAATTDPYSLYNVNMMFNLNSAGISRGGLSGSYSYSVVNNGGNSGGRPITFVSWFDAARFANWMQNGQGAGSTETGAYTLNGATSGTAPAKNPGALYFIPTENQWYKAAYYKAGGTNAGYWNYATQSDSLPGNTIGSTANQANYKLLNVYSVTQSSSYSSSQNYLTNVGAFTNSASAYGTLDQNGNVSELNDLTGAAGSNRGLRGGDWFYGAPDLGASSSQLATTSYERESIGFRLAASVAVPEPSTVASLFAGLACGGYLVRRRKRT